MIILFKYCDDVKNCKNLEASVLQQLVIKKSTFLNYIAFITKIGEIKIRQTIKKIIFFKKVEKKNNYLKIIQLLKVANKIR